MGCGYPKSPFKACEENWKTPLGGCAPEADVHNQGCPGGFVGYCKHGSGLMTYFYASKKDTDLAQGCRSAGGVFCTE
jgi:hypothetical protein